MYIHSEFKFKLFLFRPSLRSFLLVILMNIHLLAGLFCGMRSLLAEVWKELEKGQFHVLPTDIWQWKQVKMFCLPNWNTKLAVWLTCPTLQFSFHK